MFSRTTARAGTELMAGAMSGVRGVRGANMAAMVAIGVFAANIPH